jgi:uncharacterized protein (DUF1778 family)
MTIKRIPVPLSEEQHRAIKAAADALGLTMSQYLRVAALEKAKSDAKT